MTERIGSLFASEVDALLLEEARSDPSKLSGDPRKKEKIRRISARFLEIAVRPRSFFHFFLPLQSTQSADIFLLQTQIQGIAPVMVDARHEPSLRFVALHRLMLAIDRTDSSPFSTPEDLGRTRNTPTFSPSSESTSSRSSRKLQAHELLLVLDGNCSSPSLCSQDPSPSSTPNGPRISSETYAQLPPFASNPRTITDALLLPFVDSVLKREPRLSFPHLLDASNLKLSPSPSSFPALRRLLHYHHHLHSTQKLYSSASDPAFGSRAATLPPSTQEAGRRRKSFSPERVRGRLGGSKLRRNLGRQHPRLLSWSQKLDDGGLDGEFRLRPRGRSPTLKLSSSSSTLNCHFIAQQQ